jgi:CubicO group peptidase (beta-lactamase class C family)
VLAGIVEQVTGKPYGRVLEEMILTPLGMMQTTYALFNRNEPGKAVGYLSNLPGEMYDNNNTDMIGAGDGGISSTVADLHTLMISLMTDNRLLPNEKKVEIFNSPVFPVRYTSWQDVTQRGRLGVAGGSPGMNAVMALSMETGNQVVVLSNYDEGTAEEVYKRIQAVLQQKPVPPFQLPPARIIYNLIDTKGGLYFEQHYAAELTNAGVEISADDMPFLFAGRALIDEKRWQDACHLYTVYCKEYPRIVVAWNDLGDVNVELGKTAEARKCYEQALALRPGNARAKTALSKLKE